VLYLLNIGIDYLGRLVGPQIANIVKVVAFAIILIALLVLVDKTLLGGHYTGRYIGVGPNPPSIMAPERGR
jgi:hypothetical protein